MKKTMIILSAVLVLAACTKETEQASLVPVPVSPKYTYDITINRADTKAVKSGWEDGDVVCVFGTGAYCRSMASNYNGQPRPAVVFVADGQARVVTRRETYNDLMACDL